MALTPNQIDALIDGLYSGRGGGGELRQLAKLFSRKFVRGLRSLLTTQYQRPSTGSNPQYAFKEEVLVGLGYIDKIPVADFVPPVLDVKGNVVTQKTELGDAVFFFVDRRYQHGKWANFVARGLILQAKQASDAALPKQVPIVGLSNVPNNSTAKELTLLSRWDTFNLHFTASSGDVLQSGYVVSQGGAVPPHGWFVGAPPRGPAWSGPHWVAGPSQLGAQCDQSLGSLIHAVLVNQGDLGGIPNRVGAKFKFAPARLHSKNDELVNFSVPPDWGDLCHQLMLICNRYDWPANLPNVGLRARGAGFKLHAFPWEELFSGIRRFLRWRPGAVPRGSMPVLLVQRTHGEGPHPDSLHQRP
jgi:hypothetical protein